MWATTKCSFPSSDTVLRLFVDCHQKRTRLAAKTMSFVTAILSQRKRRYSLRRLSQHNFPKGRTTNPLEIDVRRVSWADFIDVEGIMDDNGK